MNDDSKLTLDGLIAELKEQQDKEEKKNGNG